MTTDSTPEQESKTMEQQEEKEEATIEAQEPATGSSSLTTTEGEEKTADEPVKQAQVLPLDWTQLGPRRDNNEQHDHEEPPIRYPSDVAAADDLSPDETDQIILVGTAGLKITHLGPDFSRQHLNGSLRQLVLRSHMIAKMEGLTHLSQLELLEFYDNQIEVLEGMDHTGETLRTLDMSYNVIRDMGPVHACPNLVELYLANNKLKTISGLQGLVHLKKIDLGANRIRVMDPDQFRDLTNLEELWLGKNKIERIDGLEHLRKLRRLDIQSNRLVTVENLQAQADVLEELYLAHNAIDDAGASQPTGLALTFTKLNVLDLNRNRLTTTDPIVHQPALEELWLSGNQIREWSAIQSLATAAFGGTIETIYLEYNPNLPDDPLYRKRLHQLVPHLTQIDADLIHGAAATYGLTTTKPALTHQQEMEQLQAQIFARAKAQKEQSTDK